MRPAWAPPFHKVYPMFTDKPAAGYDEHEHEKAEHYRQALRNSPIVFARVDTALRYEWIFNPHPDFDPSAIIGKRDDELDSGPGIDAMVALKRRALVQGVQLRQEITFERSDGAHTYDVTATPLQDAAGQFTHLITASIDITDRVRAEAALRESERKQHELVQSLQAERNRLAAVLENLPVGVGIADQDGEVIAKNKESDRIWHGDSPLLDSIAEYSEYTAWDVRTGKRLQPDDYPLAKALHAGRPDGPLELRIRRFDGSEGTVLVSAVPLHDAKGRPAGGVGINVDITARKQAEEALRESEARYRTLFDDDRSVKVLFDPTTGAIVDANAAAADFYGWPRAQMRTMNVWDIHALPRDEVWAEIAHAQAEGRSHYLFKHRRADGAVRDVEVYSTLIELDGRQLRYEIVHDITQRKQAQEALVRSEAALKRSQAVAHVGTWTWEIRSNTVTWSDEMKRIIGVRPDECGGDLAQMIGRVIHKDDAERVRAFAMSVTRNRQLVNAEFPRGVAGRQRALRAGHPRGHHA